MTFSPQSLNSYLVYMDLRGLENIQWRGFSDREIEQLHQHHINVKKASNTGKPVEVKLESRIHPQSVNAPKVDEEEEQKDSKHNFDITREQLDKKRQNELETEEVSNVTVSVALPHEVDLEKLQTKTADLQLKQKLMEEENKRRKALIEQTLQDRGRQHQLETKMLMSVKTALGDLEKVIAKDVKILRDKIEETDRFFNSAKKRFEHAETEYIAAKMELFKWSEQKELLSEHLCAVIKQNESRKAAKLDELLKSLQLDEAIGQNTNR